MMKYTGKIFLLLVITYSVLAAPKIERNTHRMTEEDDTRITNHILDSLNGLLCPPVGINHKFEVATIQTETPMYGCTFMEYDIQLSPAPLFHLWLERPEITMAHGHCYDMENMDHFIFQCLSKDNPTNRMDTEKRWKYVSLLEYKVKENSPMKNETSYRCAMYDVKDSDLDGIRIMRMAISKASNAILSVEDCEGLGNLLGEDALPFVPEGQREWPDGSLYLYMIGKKP